MKRVLAAAAALLFLPVVLLAAAVGALGGAGIEVPLGTTVGADGANRLAVAAAQAGFSGQGLRLAVAVGLAESGGNSLARNPNPPTPGCPTGSLDRGAWQLNHCYHPEVIDACADDLACAAEATYRISAAGSDWNAWTTYTSGAYRAQLAAADHAIAALVVPGIPSGSSGAELGDLVPCRPGIGIFAACPVLPDRRGPGCSACRRADPQTVAVRVPKGDLPPTAPAPRSRRTRPRWYRHHGRAGRRGCPDGHHRCVRTGTATRVHARPTRTPASLAGSGALTPW